jgi:branched-chain amino acid transport system ATP-binding protein
MEALKIEGLSKYFGGVQAVHDVSFNVSIGEKLAIIGPNGAGKTTLFNLLNGQLSPTKGHIYFYGEDITSLQTNRRAHLGMSRSFQITSLFASLTAKQNCLLALHGTRFSSYQMFRSINAYKHLLVKAEALLESVGLLEKRDELVGYMSHGEQRKLEIAISLALEPKLLLLDEPSAGLAPSESIAIMDIMRNQRKDITTLIVDHDMDLVFGVAERILVFHYGQIIADGTPHAVQNNPRVKEIYMAPEKGV